MSNWYKTTSTTFPNCYKPLSLAMYQVLEDVGVSTEMRNIAWESNIFQQISISLPEKKNGMAPYIYGFDATDLDKWINGDVLGVFNYPNVFTDTSSAGSGSGFLLDQTSSPPGFVKLQLIHNGVPIYDTSKPIELINGSDWKCSEGAFNFTVDSATGPDCIPLFRSNSSSISSTDFDVDIGLAYECAKWPACAQEWIVRKRNYNWPSQELIEKCRSLGIMLVADQPQWINTADLNWRISFPRQEALLMTSLNSVQLKCYTLLKVVNKEFIQPLTKKKLISSYDCKTCLFSMIENTPKDVWRPENLLQCVNRALNLLNDNVQNGTMYDYFIWDRNLFDNRMNDLQRKELVYVLETLIQSECRFLPIIRTAFLGERYRYRLFKQNKSKRPLKAIYAGPLDKLGGDRLDAGLIRRSALLLSSLTMLFQTRYRYLHQLIDSTLEKSTNKLLRIVTDLKQSKALPNCTEKETRRFTTLVLPYIELALLSNCLAVAVERRQSREHILQYLSSTVWHNISVNSDKFSSRLKQALHMYALRDYRASLFTLQSLGKREEVQMKLSFCGCRIEIASARQMLERSVRMKMKNIEEIVRSDTIPCVMFQPTEKCITPTALCYEIMGLKGKLSNSLVCVDGKFLLYFLLYLNHSAANETLDATRDIYNMEKILSNREVSHLGTCLNLLGWSYKMQRHFEKAMKSFQKSLTFEDSRDIASWHICFMICDHVVSKGSVD